MIGVSLIMVLSRRVITWGNWSKRVLAIGALAMPLVYSGLAQAEYRLNFQDPVTQTARDIYGLHMLIFWICVAIFICLLYTSDAADE